MLFLDDVSTGFGSIRPGSANVDVNSSTGQNWLCRSVAMPKFNLSKRPFLQKSTKNNINVPNHSSIFVLDKKVIYIHINLYYLLYKVIKNSVKSKYLVLNECKNCTESTFTKHIRSV